MGLFNKVTANIIEGEASIERIYYRWIGPRTYEVLIRCGTKYPKLIRYGGDTVLLGVETFSLHKNIAAQGVNTQISFPNYTVELVELAQRYEFRCVIVKKSIRSFYHLIYSKRSQYGEIIDYTNF